MTAYQFGRCLLDLRTHELLVDGERVHLEPQVFGVLSYLVAHRDRLVNKTELLDALWGDQFVSESALTSRIKSARSAIGDDGTSQQLIRTQRGSGYRFVGAVQVIEKPPARSDSPQRRTGALPSARFALIGRVDEIEAVESLLAAHRCVTISGPGGIGKSTLALALARKRADDAWLDVAFVELAPARHHIDVVRAVAEATGVEGVGAVDVATLAANLSSRTLLLVLDNCEHLLEASAELVDSVLDACPGVVILATSREPLATDGEAVYVLGSLGRDATTLFVERATAATGRATVAAADPDVVDVCERLDGLPLAIELAAAQMRHLTLTELSNRLDERLGLLVGGRPRAGERHATLTATIEWSYQLLSAASRVMFERLGVFPASFDLPTVQAVCPDLDPVAATVAIGDLVAKSLVVRDHTRGRYRLLETIRLFASHRLDEAGHRAELTERLRQHVVNRVTAQPRAQAWASASLAAQNHDDIENVRAAFDASIARGQYADAIDIMVGLSSLWRNAVSYAEGRRWVVEVQQRDLAVRERLWSHLVAADIGLGSGDTPFMASSAAAAIDLCRLLDDPGATVIATTYRSLAAMSQPEQAIAGLEAARDQAREADEPELERVTRAFRAVALMVAGQRADDEIRELTAAVSNGYDRYICIWAAWVQAMADRDGPSLRGWMDRQFENLRSTGLRENWLTAFCLALAMIGEGADHLPSLRQARRRAEAEGRRADVDCVLALAYAAACRNDPVRAAELVGTSGGGLFHDTANFVHYMIIRDRVVRPQLDPSVFDDAIERGRQWAPADILVEHGL